MPYVFVRETLHCRASALDALAAIYGARDRLAVDMHAARFQVNYQPGSLRSFVIGNTTAQASSCEVVLKFYVSRNLAKLLLLAAALLAASAALHLWPLTGAAAVALAALTIKAALDFRALSSFFHGLLD